MTKKITITALQVIGHDMGPDGEPMFDRRNTTTSRRKNGFDGRRVIKAYQRTGWTKVARRDTTRRGSRPHKSSQVFRAHRECQGSDRRVLARVEAPGRRERDLYREETAALGFGFGR